MTHNYKLNLHVIRVPFLLECFIYVRPVDAAEMHGMTGYNRADIALYTQHGEVQNAAHSQQQEMTLHSRKTYGD